MTTAIVAGIMTGVAAPAAAQGPDVVLPILTCVEPVPHPTEFRLRAHFGYVSTYSSEVTIPIGQNNFFTPGATNRGQPTIFVPGFHPRQFSTEWAVSGSSTRITWVTAGGTAAARNHTGFLCNVRARGPWDPAETYELGDVVTVSIAGAAEPFVLLETGCSPTQPPHTSACWYSYVPTPPAIVVERAMYSNANGVTWAAGTNATATRLP